MENESTKYPTVPYVLERRLEARMVEDATQFADIIVSRRSVRMFSDERVPQEVIEQALRSATSAPSGANQQPWKFVVVKDPELKRQIRIGAEEEERISYSGRMPAEWLRALAPLQTDWRKEFLEIAPILIVVFREDYGVVGETKIKHYYVSESVGIACGFLLAALHFAGLAALTHTPSPMGFLREILQRPENEKPYLLIPVGYPAVDCRVPDIARKSPDQVIVWK